MSAYRKDGKLVIEIDEAELIKLTWVGCPGVQQARYTVEHPSTFLRHCLAQLNDDTSGPNPALTALHQLQHALVATAVKESKAVKDLAAASDHNEQWLITLMEAGELTEQFAVRGEQVCIARFRDILLHGTGGTSKALLGDQHSASFRDEQLKLAIESGCFRNMDSDAVYMRKLQVAP